MPEWVPCAQAWAERGPVAGAVHTVLGKHKTGCCARAGNSRRRCNAPPCGRHRDCVRVRMGGWVGGWAGNNLQEATTLVQMRAVHGPRQHTGVGGAYIDTAHRRNGTAGMELAGRWEVMKEVWGFLKRLLGREWWKRRRENWGQRVARFTPPAIQLARLGKGETRQEGAGMKGRREGGAVVQHRAEGDGRPFVVRCRPRDACLACGNSAPVWSGSISPATLPCPELHAVVSGPASAGSAQRLPSAAALPAAAPAAPAAARTS